MRGEWVRGTWCVVRGGARAAFLGGILWSAAVRGEAQTSQAIKLRDLSATVHVVVAVDSLASASGLSEDSLQARVESDLRQAGFSLSPVFGGAYVGVEIHALGIMDLPMLVYDVAVEYRTQLVPARRLTELRNRHLAERTIPDSELTRVIATSVNAPLYRRAVYGIGGKGNAAAAMTRVALGNLAVFAKDFFSVNPRD